MTKESAKGKKSTKSSKTARVLGLLTDPVPAGAAAETAAPAGKTSTRASDEDTQDQIRSALEQELAALAPEPPADTPRPEASPAETGWDALDFGAAETEAPAVQEPEPVAQEPAPDPAPVPVPEEAAPEATLPAQPEEEAKTEEEPEEPEFTCFNIMQSLVESKADQYIQMFGGCTCPRCRIDVIALALSNLPPKYVVTTNRRLLPLLATYEGNHGAAIIAQLVSACERVKAKPRHKL